MKAAAIALVWVAACIGGGPPGEVQINHPPPILPGVETSLAVPASCPIYTPDGGDANTPEAPFPRTINVLCGVDSVGPAYGLVTGDTGHLAIVPGHGEVGLYIDFFDEIPFDVEGLKGAEPAIKAWEAPLNSDFAGGSPERDDANRIILRPVAVGPRGLLLSVGQYDGTATQVSFMLGDEFGEVHDGWMGRFYVNGAPPPP